MKKRFLLQLDNPKGDCNFLNATSIYFFFVNNYGPEDSGWCDWDTGARIINKEDKIILVTEDDQEEAVIRFTFGERIQYLEEVGN